MMDSNRDRISRAGPWRALCALVVVAGFALRASAGAAPELMSYQGLLMLPNGTLVEDGIYDLEFSIYEQPEGGTPLYRQTLNVNVRNGLYNVFLTQGDGGERLAEAFGSGAQRFIHIVATGGTEPLQYPVQFNPRQQIGSVPYALNSGSGELGLLQGRLVYVGPDSVALQPSYGEAVRVEIDGLVYEEIGGLQFSISADLDVGPENTGFYYLYLSGAAGSAVPHVSATGPQLSAPGKVGYHPVNSNWRFVGSVYNNPSLDIEPFDKLGPDYLFRTLQFRINLGTTNPATIQELDLDDETPVDTVAIHFVDKHSGDDTIAAYAHVSQVGNAWDGTEDNLDSALAIDSQLSLSASHHWGIWQGTVPTGSGVSTRAIGWDISGNVTSHNFWIRGWRSRFGDWE